jgi:hypothetical protein
MDEAKFERLQEGGEVGEVRLNLPGKYNSCDFGSLGVDLDEPVEFLGPADHGEGLDPVDHSTAMVKLSNGLVIAVKREDLR